MEHRKFSTRIKEANSPARLFPTCWNHQHSYLHEWSGPWRDNAMIERLWRSLKYEYIYLHAVENGTKARQRISEWVAFYKERRPHSHRGGADA